MEDDNAAERCEDGVDEQRIGAFAAQKSRRQQRKQHGDADAEANAKKINAQRREKRHRQEDPQMEGVTKRIDMEYMFCDDKHQHVEENEEGKVQEETQDVSKTEKFPVITFIIGVSIALILFVVNTIFAFI